MSAVMEEEINRWTARRKSALVLEIIQGKATVGTAPDFPVKRPWAWGTLACQPARFTQARPQCDHTQ
ncbi:MAG: hypothetical protein ACR2J7_06275 [Luteimonas sp.]